MRIENLEEILIISVLILSKKILDRNTDLTNNHHDSKDIVINLSGFIENKGESFKILHNK